jgi:hypothetical protein
MNEPNDPYRKDRDDDRSEFLPVDIPGEAGDGGTLVQRRGLLKRMSSLGAFAVGAIATTWADAPAAFASPGCCDLANPNGPWCGGHKGSGTFSCSGGTQKTVWYCSTGCWVYSCYECSGGPSCFTPPWPCSNYIASYRC